MRTQAISDPVITSKGLNSHMVYFPWESLWLKLSRSDLNQSCLINKENSKSNCSQLEVTTKTCKSVKVMFASCWFGGCRATCATTWDCHTYQQALVCPWWCTHSHLHNTQSVSHNNKCTNKVEGTSNILENCVSCHLPETASMRDRTEASNKWSAVFSNEANMSTESLIFSIPNLVMPSTWHTQAQI